MDKVKNIRTEWLIVNIVGFEVGVILGVIACIGAIAASTVLPFLNSDWSFGGIIGLIVGLLVGLLQYLMLRNRISISFPWLWVIAYTVGIPIGEMVATYAGFNPSPNPFALMTLLLPWILGGLTMGIIIGGLQWITVRKNLPRSEIWIIWTIIASVVVIIFFSYPSIFYMGTNEGPSDSGFGILFGLIQFLMCIGSGLLAGLLYGLITWIPLRKLLKENVKENKSPA